MSVSQQSLQTIFRLSEARPPVVIRMAENWWPLRNIMAAELRQLERENYPGSWAWRHPK